MPRRSKSGNGKIGRQNLYVLMNFPWVWAWKVGITGKKVGVRAAQINSKMRKECWYSGWFIPMSWVEITFAYPIEQVILDLTEWAKITVFGAGGTEIRFIIPGVFIWIVVLIMSILSIAFWFLVKWVFTPVLLFYLLEYFLG